MIPKKPSNVIWSDEQWQAIYEDVDQIIQADVAGGIDAPIARVARIHRDLDLRYCAERAEIDLCPFRADV